MQPERMDTASWYGHTRAWHEGAICDAHASIAPDTAGACEAHPWLVTVTLGDMTLEPGDHVAVELNVGWRLDRGRPYVYGTQPFRSQWSPGYNAAPRFDFGPGVESEWAASEPEQMNRYFILDAVVTRGSVPAGGEFRIYLADPDGSLLRCPWFAQDAPVPVAMRKADQEFYHRAKTIPTVHVRGGHARLWKLAATPQPDGRNVRVQAIAADVENLNPSDRAPDPTPLPCTGWAEPAFERVDGYHGAPVWRATVPVEPGAAARLEALDREAGLYGRSNPIAPDLYDGMQVFFGDLHGQSDRSIGYGTEREYFWWARDAELLDFTAPANHYGGREVVTQDLWRSTLELCDEFDDAGRFVTLYSYEWAGGGHAHRNVYYAERPGLLLSAKIDAKYNAIDALWAGLAEQGLPALTIPHHPKFIGRIDWSEHHAGYQRLVEACSCWGNSEVGSVHSVQHGLAMGHRLGVVGGTDTHFSQPGRPVLGPFDLGGYTAVIAPSLDRASVWRALHERRCYATTGERLLLDFRINGRIMGAELTDTGARRITGRVVGTAELDAVEIVRNNTVWQRVPTEGLDQVAFELEDADPFDSLALEPEVGAGGRFVFYYLRATQHDRHWAMSSPIWIAPGR